MSVTNNVHGVVYCGIVAVNYTLHLNNHLQMYFYCLKYMHMYV